MDLNDLNKKMDSSISYFEKELSTLRTSRANPSILDNILVDAYGSKTPINQLGNISIPDSSTITIQVWDTNLLKNIETAITESSLGINPQSDGSLIRLPIPKLSEERRQELSKVASQFSESSKVSIRNIRREAIDSEKNKKKENQISEDELKKNSSKIQEITDEYINKIDLIFENKKKDILKV
tara:strand:- start:2313 stop:2861 length:549 start_codon:yes stop_codon:yes gene_type:complete